MHVETLDPENQQVCHVLLAAIDTSQADTKQTGDFKEYTYLSLI